MASAPQPSWRARQPWRARSRTTRTSREAKRARRWLLTVVVLLLAALLAWQLWKLLFTWRVYLAALPVDDYPALSVPPAAFCADDFLALSVVDNQLVNLSGYGTGE